MDDEIKEGSGEEQLSENMDQQESEVTQEGHSDYKPVNRFDAAAVHHLSGMYQNWFLDYASYVILERAVPHLEDGLKPVQRRILHSMKRMDDGRYNKVANIVGHTMQFHPHGDASIGDALVQMGQKDLLIDTQGNWGNILTGSSAAAPRYIEARLSKFALDTVFNPKTTEWKMSYDGRNKEPITLPVKFPLLLAQGAEGIAVGLSSKILPHNFCEICDAAISYLHDQPFRLYPDFPTSGSIDVSKYNDGQRGGVVKVRAKIEKIDQKTLVIREIPFSKTSETLQDSIVKAIEKGKNQGQKGRGPYCCQRRDTGTSGSRCFQRQDHRCPLCLHRLRNQHLAQLLRHRGQQTAIPHHQRRTATLCRSYERPHPSRAGNPQERTARAVSFPVAGEDIHRGTHLQR